MHNTLGAPYGGQFVLTKAGLTGISGAATTYSTGATAQTYAINGKAYTKAQVSGGTTPTTDGITAVAFAAMAVSTGSIYFFCLNAAGTVSVAQGSVEALDSAGNFRNYPQWPEFSDAIVPFSYVVVKNGSTGSSWTFGTSNWNATGITVSVQDLITLPNRPQGS